MVEWGVTIINKRIEDVKKKDTMVEVKQFWV